MWWIKDCSGKPSASLTIAGGGAVTVLLKVLLNGVVIGSLVCGSIDAALATGVLATTLGLYWGRRNTEAKTAAAGAPPTTAPPTTAPPTTAPPTTAPTPPVTS